MIEITIDQPAQGISFKIPIEMRQKLIDAIQSMSDESDTFTIFIDGDKFIVNEIKALTLS